MLKNALCCFVEWDSFNSFWQFSVVEVWLQFSLHFFKAKSQVDESGPSLVWCRDQFYCCTLVISFYSKRTHIKNNLLPEPREDRALLFLNFPPTPTPVGRNSISTQEDPDAVHLPSVATGMNEACRWEQPQHLAAHLLPPDQAFSVSNYTLLSFQSIA